jgi:hypothetical protein
VNIEVDRHADLVAATRDAFLDGCFSVPAALGLSGVAPHIERSERDCVTVALGEIAKALGPAGRLIDAGPFESQTIATVLAGLKNPKMTLVLREDCDPRHRQRLEDANSTSEILHLAGEIDDTDWNLPSSSGGKTLFAISGNGFSHYDRERAFDILDTASEALARNDLVLLTLEQPTDAAVLEVLYQDFCDAIVAGALGKLGRQHQLKPRVFFNAQTHVLHFGALALDKAYLTWNGTCCDIPDGTWIEIGQIALTDIGCAGDLHPDFGVANHWTSQDGLVSLLLLRKL